jgi:undecaprenyl-phosphate 4-deoxy-4-formamido-L-arabinose transferase
MMPEIFSSPQSLSVIVPVFNSQATLPLLVQRLAAVLTDLQHPYEIILVDDGSRDASWETILTLHRDFPEVRGVHLMRNYGQHNAQLCGVRLARNEIIITLDDDLQNPPEEIPKLLAGLPGYDVVYGDPHLQQHGLWRNFASWFIRLALQSAMGVENARKVSAFRAFRSGVREAFANYRSPFVTLDVLLSWGTTAFNVVDVHHDARPVGRSNYTLRRLLRHAADMITGFTILPLQLASWMGMLLAGFGILVLFYVVGRFIISGGSVPGFPFLASIIAIFSGAQLFALGIIGEYLARIHLRIMDKPSYVVREEATR